MHLGIPIAALLLFLATPASAEKQLLWGDTHVHTNYSTDAYLNQNFTASPDTAYRFAKGQPVREPATGGKVQIQTPLDFLVVTDHAGGMGTVKLAIEEGFPREGLGFSEWMRSWTMEKLFRLMAKNPGYMDKLLERAFPDTDDVREAADIPANLPIPYQREILIDTWRDSTNTAEAHNEPGVFTAIIGWEWTSIPAGANLHRVVFTDGNASSAQQFVPRTAPESNHPVALWRWLEEVSAKTGDEFISIPHNSNISRGFMFPVDKRLDGEPIDREWIDLRAKWERVVEITQIKGDSETHPVLSPDDPFADFESYPHIISPREIPYDPQAGDFVRSALRTGLALEEQFGANPYQFGIIGSTDSHTGLATAEEPNFWGKFPTDATLDRKMISLGDTEKFGWVVSASGLAAVWAENNDREHIMQAFKRREVYGTTGPRIGVRVYGGVSPATTREEGEPDFDLDTIISTGVPMGGELNTLESAPSFYIEAMSDPKSGYLDRIQMVKGWMVNGETFEKVYDVAWSGDRQADENGNIPAIVNTVDPKTGQFSNEHGAPALTTMWTDPDFDPAQPAFYYARVLEIPTPRHSTLDALALNIPAEDTGQPISLQERAYTSPIHYRP
jgi:hypothetical protein